jgi:hypothetical protein
MTIDIKMYNLYLSQFLTTICWCNKFYNLVVPILNFPKHAIIG